MPAFNNWNF